MNILIYRRGFLPQSETFIADHVQYLRRYDPSILTEHHIPGGINLPNYPLHRLHRPGDGAISRLGSKLFGHNPSVAETLPQGSFALLHAHFLSDGANVAMLARRHRLPLVVTAHGYDATVRGREHLRRWDGRLYLLMKPLLARWAAGFICVSDYIRERLIENGFPQSKLRVIRLGIDTRAIDPPPPSADRRGVLSVGRLVEKKGTRYLLDAWARLPEPLRGERLTILGDGPLRGELEEQARRLGIDATFLGARPRAEVFRQMRQHRVLAMPSVRAKSGDAEGLGIVLLEAQALGMVPVTFDEGPMHEAILPGISGLTARSRDSGSLAQAIASLLSQPDRAEAMAAAGIAHVRAKFDIRARMDALEDYYDEVVARCT
ncbi:glycosyl transferase [Sphingomonas oleivorans]|uniref:Glycosyl transferase n=1 Tax=Sphingomonas oleivorans TaxID=1735121 RepID=A0A2T5FYU9_9SPHN|nr:glycosyltransferase [Sphingomonas oleivorans]PTQ11787.1 glycosyl transferase [Sphingomonas oleivorans]